MPPALTKAQALEIFVQLANAFRATPSEHETIRAAYATLAALPEPAPATVTAAVPTPAPESITQA